MRSPADRASSPCSPAAPLFAAIGSNVPLPQLPIAGGGKFPDQSMRRSIDPTQREYPQGPLLDDRGSKRLDPCLSKENEAYRPGRKDRLPEPVCREFARAACKLACRSMSP